MKVPITLGMFLIALTFVACGGGSQHWKAEFASQIEKVIDAANQLAGAIRSAAGPKDLQRPYLRYAGELQAAEERLKALDSAPDECAEYERNVIAYISWRIFASRNIADPKNYTPELLRSAKADPRKTVKRLKYELSQAHCR